MRLVKTSAGIGVLLALTFAPVYAGQKGNSGNHDPKTTTTHGQSSTTKHGSLGPSTTTHGPAAKAPSAKPTTPTNVTKADTKLAKVDAESAKSKKTDTTTTTTASTSTSTTSTGGTTTSTPTIDFTSGPVGEKLSKNSALRSKVESRLTALGYDGTVYQAAYGFKNLGLFVAATNVSRNLGISFEQIKTQMTGLSVDADGTVVKASLGTDGTVAPTKSLGQAIHAVKSSIDATAAAETATTQADAEIRGTTTTVSK